MRPAVTVVASAGDGTSKAELEAALNATHPGIPVVHFGGLSWTEILNLDEVAHASHLWFLTPDSRPEPQCLEELLDAISATESIAAVGPKITNSGLIVSAGVTTTSAGSRVNPVGTGEIDQGQRDGDSETLGLDLPGLLIRAEEFERIGPPSSRLGVDYRGIEYSRRLRDLGKRVVLAPRAHLEIGAEQTKRLGTSPHPPLSKFQIRSEQRYRLSLSSPGLFPLLLRLFFSLAVSGLGALLANDVRSAGWYFSALFGLGSDAGAMSGLRRANAKRNRRSGTAHVTSLYADDEELAVQRRSLATTAAAANASEPPTIDDADLHQIGDTEEEIDSFSRLEISGGPGLLRHPLTVLLLGSLVMSGFFSYRLFGPGHLDGGALGASNLASGDVVSRLLSPVLDIGTLATVPADPYHLVIGVLSLPFFGNVDLMLRTLILIAPTAAAITAYFAAALFVRGNWTRALAGLLWIAAPVFTGALTTGAVGVLWAWIAAPLFVLSARRTSVAATAAAGFFAFLLIAGIPLLLIPVLVLLVVLFIKGRGLRTMWLILPTVFLAWPWLARLVQEPGAVFVMPGQTLAPEPAPSYLLALGFPTPLDLDWLSTLLSNLGISGVDAQILATWLPIISLPMLILAFFTLIEARLNIRRLLWSVGLYLLGLILAFAQSLIPAQVGPFNLIGSYPAAGLLLAGLGAVMMLVMGADRTTAAPTSARRLPMHGLVSLVAAAAIVLIVIGAGTATTAEARVSTRESDTLPALAADRAAGPTQARTLFLEEINGEVLASLRSTADGTVLGTSTISSAEAVGGWPWERRPQPIGPDRVLIAQTAAALSADEAGDARSLLGRLGTDYVLVDGESNTLQSSVAAAAGLVRVGPTDAGVLWQVDKSYSGRFLIKDADGNLTTAQVDGHTIDVPEGGDGRSLYVADAAATVTAEMDGRALPLPQSSADDNSEEGWAAEFSLPASGGTVEISDGSPLYAPGVILGWFLGLISLIVAIPFGARRSRSAGGSS